MHEVRRNIPRTATARTILALVAVLAAGMMAQAQAGQKWLANREYRRPVLGGGDADTVAVSFQGGGHLADGARDVLVVDTSRHVLPSKVLHTRRGHQTWLAYQGSAAKGRVFLYYGPTRSSAEARSQLQRGGRADWQPRLSLMLKTMPLPPGAFDSSRPIAAMARTDRIYGMGFVDKVHLGHNPYGPDDKFATAITGFLQIQKPGRYHIFTVSDDASFVLLDGRPLCSWPGKHDFGGRFGEHGRTIELKKRVYRIEYYHAEDTDTQVLCLGWTPPWDLGKKKGKTVKVELVPTDAFLHTPVGKAGEPARRDAAPLAAFHWNQRDQLLTEERQYTRVAFHPQCENVPQDATVEWRFGDGVVAQGNQPRDHIYVGDGPFTCTIRVVSAQKKPLDEFQAVVRIETPMENLTLGDEQPLAEYIDAITRYRCARVSDETMRALWELVDISENVKAIQDFCTAMVRQFGLEGVGWHAGDRLALALSIAEPEKAEKLYANLAARAPERFDAARCRIERIEVILHKLEDTERALGLAETLRDRSSGWQARLGAVKVGDVYRARGEFEKAEAIYRKAAKIAYGATDRRLVAMRQGGYLETANTYIRDGFLRATREILIKWEAQYPDGKLGGDLILMTAKYFEKLGDPQRALDELATLTQINPLTPYLPEVELRMARAHARLGNKAKANELYEKVIYEYPQSRAAREAQKERY
jgi:tetratricopeptide (TPR) repeat protein